MTRTFRFVLFSLLPSFITSLLPSSTPAQVTTGTPPFGSFAGGPDVINLGNNNAHLCVPVLHKAGRGTPFTYDLCYDSSVWYPSSVNGTNTWTPVWNWGWAGQTQIASGYVDYKYTQGGCNIGTRTDPYVITYDIYSFKNYHDQFGTIHPINIIVSDNGGQCPNGSQAPSSATGTLSDGSGYSVYVDTGPTVTIYPKIGGVINPPLQAGTGSATFTDRNGNKITADGSGHFYDTLSSTTPVLTVAGTAPGNTTFTYTAPSGANASYTVKYTTYTIRTNFGCSGVPTEFDANGTVTASLGSEIDLPDYNSSTNANSRYLFTYETTPGDTHSPHHVTARLTQVTLPTGGTITYTYTGGNNGITCADGSTAGLTRVLSDGAGWSATWNYTRTAGTGSAYAARITDPLGNDTIIQFQGIYETQRDIYNGAGPAFSSVPITESTLAVCRMLLRRGQKQERASQLRGARSCVWGWRELVTRPAQRAAWCDGVACQAGGSKDASGTRG